jgi:hypothetical protein
MRGLSTVEWIAKHPLSKGKRAQNIARFPAWQMRSRLIRKPHVFETANGAKMWAMSGMTARPAISTWAYMSLRRWPSCCIFCDAATCLLMLTRMSALTRYSRQWLSELKR